MKLSMQGAGRAVSMCMRMGIPGGALALLLTQAAAAHAAGGVTGVGKDTSRHARGDKDGLRYEILERITAIRREKLTRALELDDPTASRLFAALARFDGQEHELARQRMDVFRDLRRSLEAPKQDTGRVEALLDRMSSLHVRRVELEQDKVLAVRKVLPPLQVARFVLTYPRIEEEVRSEIRQLIDKARGERRWDHRGGRPNPKPDGGPPKIP